MEGDATQLKNSNKSKNPYESAKIISKLFFIWIFPLLKLGASKNLTLQDLYPIRKVDVTEDLGNELEEKWNLELQLAKKMHKRANLIKALWNMFAEEYIWIVLLEIVSQCTLAVAQPIFLRWFIQSFGDENVSKQQQFIYAASVCLVSLAATFSLRVAYYYKFLIAMRCRISLTSLVYRKSMKLSSAGSNQVSIGHVLNLMATDVHRLDGAIIWTTAILFAPIQLCLFSYILLEEIGYPTLVGVGLVTMIMPLQYFLGKYTSLFRSEAAERVDERARFMSEIINGIRVIKMYAWEGTFSNLIHKLRALEVKSLKKLAYLIGTYTGFNMVAIQPIMLVTMFTYTLTGNKISADKVFFAMAIFNTLFTTLLFLMPQGVAGISGMFVTLNRLEKYLAHDEQKLSNGLVIHNHTTISQPSIETKNVSASWMNDKLTLNNLSMNLSGDSLVAIVGAVGSGKSSFINLLIGELPILSGNCTINGTTSYASQEAWIFSGSVRQNIIFGLEYDETHYKRVVEACALEQDFSQFEYGDGTIVGERGITLSGGQKARVNLARALYRKADIYLLDDPLSAVDARVSRHLFEKCIKNFLSGHLRILVTHQIHYLVEADHIIVLNNDGKILAQGSYPQLQEQNVDILNILKSDEKVEDSKDFNRRRSSTLSLENQPLLSEVEASDTYIEKEQEDQEELISYESVSVGVYASYFKSSKSTIATIFVFGLFGLAQVLLSGSYWWLSIWTDYEETRQKASKVMDNVNTTDKRGVIDPRFLSDGGDNYQYLWVYVGLVGASILAVVILIIAYFSYVMRIGVNVHDNMFQSLVRAPAKFYDTNSPGRILNRITRDLNQMDINLPEMLFDTVKILMKTIATVVIVSLSNYYVLIPTGVFFVVLYFIRQYYVKTIRDVKRIEAVSRSPVFNQLASSFQGIGTIRSSKSQGFITKQFELYQDNNNIANFMYLSTTRWFAVWIELIAILYFTVITFSYIILTTSSTAGGVGVAMVSIMELNISLQWGIRQSSEVENIMTAFERILEYINTKSESALHSSEPKLGKSWITKGEIIFDSVSLIYDEKPVLKNLTFTVKGQEKIGIVGRTGAGKSSIISALFRLTEPTGSIYIDNIRINDIGLHDLRENISIIPQEPQLFSGTMRYNLDPFNQFLDDDLWKVLEEVSLKSVVNNLDIVVTDGGSNFSIGERQLVCLARAILRQNKILVMDEATANVDLKTDRFIQTTIKEKFSSCTIITIAHRLHSVMDCDRILVLESGELKEYDHPYDLLQNPDGVLKALVDQAGKGARKTLYTIAEQHFKSKT